MKKLFIVLITLCYGAFISAQDNNTIVLPLSNPGERGWLGVEVGQGGITVTGSNRKDVQIKYFTEKGKKIGLVAAKNGLKRISGGSPGFEVIEDDNEVNIETQNNNKEIRFEIEIPKNFDLELDCHNGGDIIVNNVSGEIDIENHNGSVFAKDISGSLIANTYNGKLVASFLSLNKENPSSLSSYNHDVDVTLPANAKVSPRVKSEQGEVLTGFDMEFEPIVAKRDDEDGGTKIYVGGWINGKINGGGPEMRIETYNGNVYIRKKE